jgi:hypothetical protein
MMNLPSKASPGGRQSQADPAGGRERLARQVGVLQRRHAVAELPLELAAGTQRRRARQLVHRGEDPAAHPGGMAHRGPQVSPLLRGDLGFCFARRLERPGGRVEQ